MSSFARLMTVLIAVAGLLLLGGVLVWYLAYGIAHNPPGLLALDAVTDTVEIGWGAQGVVSIDARRTDDAMAALGYAHGRDRAWSAVLWRQAALGRLSEWFGAPAVPIDRLTRSLALAAMARESYNRLDDEDRSSLEAYTAGFNAALHGPAVRLRQEFVLLGQDPQSWQPWHTLAVERLLAWIAAPPPSPATLEAADSVTTAFFEADRMLRQWLHLHGFENSVAWIARDAEGSHLFHRHVYGDTALPLYQEVILNLADAPSIRGGSLPGTPFFPVGVSETSAWGVLLTTSARLERIPWHPDSATVDYQRILNKDGAEHLISFWRMPGRLPLLPPPGTPPPDTVWSIRWAGFTRQSDVAAWRAVWTGAATPFRLLEGGGLQMDRDGTWRVLGAPRVMVPLPSGIFVGSSPWSAYTAEFLRTQAGDPASLESWINDAYSIWAAQIAPPLVNAAGDLADTAPELRDALTYLRNWDYTYDRASIAASIFDRWMTIYFDTTGTLPGMTQSDSIVAAGPMVQTSLIRAVEALIDAYGPDQSQWRWEHINPDRRFFPIWSVEALQEAGEAPTAQTRFAAVDWPGHGHPSALAWGPSSTHHTRAAPAVWEAWHRASAWGTLAVRRRHLTPHAPLGRYLISDRLPAPIMLPSSFSAASTTTLTPPAP